MLLYLVFEKRLNIRETVNYQAQDDTAPIPPILLLRGRFLNARPAASRPSDQVLNHQWLTQISCVIESLIQAVTVFLEEEECQEGLPKCYPLNRPQVAAVLPINLDHLHLKMRCIWISWTVFRFNFKVEKGPRLHEIGYKLFWNSLKWSSVY